MKKPLRILQILPSLEMGGVEQGTIDTALAIQKSGNIPFVISSGGRFTKELTKNNIQHITLPVNSKNPILMYINIFIISIIIFLKKIDIVHARSRAPAWSSYFACLITGCKFVTTFHGFYSGYNNIIKNKYNSVMTYGEKIIVPTDFMKDHLKKYYKVDFNKVIKINRGIDTQKFQNISKERVELLKNKYKLKNTSKKIIILPGRLTDWKGQILLIELAKKIQNNNYIYILAGNGSNNYIIKIKDLINKYNLQDQFIIDTSCEDIPALYNLCDLCLSLSTSEETFGRVAVEAQASGKNILASNIGGSCETIIDDVSGRLFINNSLEDLEKKINYIINNGISYKEKAIENSKNFDVSVFNKKIVDFYENL